MQILAAWARVQNLEQKRKSARFDTATFGGPDHSTGIYSGSKFDSGNRAPESQIPESNSSGQLAMGASLGSCWTNILRIWGAYSVHLGCILGASWNRKPKKWKNIEKHVGFLCFFGAALRVNPSPLGGLLAVSWPILAPSWPVLPTSAP